MIAYEEALGKSLEYFSDDELAASVFVDKYALRDKEGNLLEAVPSEMHRRIAREIARVEAGKFAEPMGEDEVYGYLDGFRRLVPQGGPMYGIGNPYQYISVSNCYVADSPLDSYSSILHTDEQLVQISKRRGGVGIDLSHLRPARTRVNNAARTSSGVVSFMQRYSNSIREVGQDGRRGALMLTLSVHHPEVLEFASAKNDEKSVTGANISVRLSDDFLRAVDADEDYEQRWPLEGEPVISRMVSAKKVWKALVKNAHHRAEPGLLFWDQILRESPADCYAAQGFRTISTNPCSELPLSILDSCRLLVLNLFYYVNNPFTEDAYFDYDLLHRDAQVAQRFMDDIIDLELEMVDRIIAKIDGDPEPEEIKGRERRLWERVRKACEDGRRTGTGITALGDVLAALGIRYGSGESIEVTDKIYRTLKLGCYRSSVDMARELGPFPVWDAALERDNPFLLRIRDEDPELYEDMQKHGRRNIALLTTAPTGTVSIETRTSSGIEPVFMLSYTRRKKINHNDDHIKVDFVDQSGDRWQEYVVYHPHFKTWMNITGKKDVCESPYHMATAEEIDWRQRVELQATANRHVDHAISSTLNLPEDVTIEQVAEIYETAHRAGCKGITVYRKGCRTGVLVENKEKDKEKIQKTTALKRPKSLPCEVHHVTAKGERFFVIVGLVDGEPYEVFAANDSLPRKLEQGVTVKVKRGCYELRSVDGEVIRDDISSDCTDDQEALTRLTSTSLRHGADIGFVVHQLEKVKGDMQGFAKGLGRVLKKYITDGAKVHGEVCRECGQEGLVRNSGCVLCPNCGWSKCS